MKRFLWLFLALCIGVTLHAQNSRGSISGQITDPAGAAVVNANITVTNTDNGAVTNVVSRQEGLYNAPGLLPGNYAIGVNAAGFKAFDRKGITVAVQANVTINVKLEIGAASEVVTVTEAPPMIDTADASSGQVLTSEEVQNLPSNGSSPLGFARIEYGVVAKGKHAGGNSRPIDNSTVDDFSLGGGNSASNELLLDGVNNMQDSSRTAGFSPSLDAVDAVRVDLFGANVTYGDSSGGTVNITTKSGSNQFHGSLREVYQAAGCSSQSGSTFVSHASNNCSWMAATPWSTRAGNSVPSATHFNQFGGTIGGPIWIPKVFNGHNKLFFFYGYEGWKGSQPPAATTGTVPTAAERQGDFSALLALGSAYQLYNPYSATGTQTNYTRTAIPNNCLTSGSSNCSSNAGLTLNPIAQAYLKMVPLPNVTGSADGENNYFTFTPSTNDYRSHTARVDYNLSANDKLFGKAYRSKQLQGASNYFHNALTGTTTDTIMAGVLLEEIHTFTPNLIMDIRGSLTRYDNNAAINSAGISPTSLGFPSYLAANSISLGIPYITFSDASGPLAYSGKPGGLENYDTLQFFSTVTWLHRTHSYLIGTDLRATKGSYLTPNYANGTFAFSRGNGGPMTASNSAAYQTFGSSMALFMLGIPTGGSENIGQAFQYNSYLHSAFIQDDWRPKPNLTISYGIRLEHEIPVNESQNRITNGFNQTATNGITTAAEAAYATKPGSLLAASSFLPVGGATYASSAVRHAYHTAPLYWSPRIGMAWTPEFLKGKGVVRLGFGIYSNPFNNYSQSQTYGYSATTTYVSSSTNGITNNTLSDPFPTSSTSAAVNPIQTPTGNTLGINANLGSSIVFYPNHVKVPYSERISLDTQYQVNKSMMIELGYIYNHQVHLSYSNAVSSIPLLPYLSRSQYYDVYTTDKLSGATYTGGPATTNATNPFKGLTGMTGSLSTSSTIAPSQYLLNFPQYSGVTQQLIPGSSSNYNALNARVAQTLSHGLTLNGVFEWSRLLGTFNQLNAGDALNYGETTSDYPFHLSIYGTYQLPFGKGREFFHNKFLDPAIGGWQISAIYQFLSGTPNSWGNVIYTGSGWKDFNNKQHSSANVLGQPTFNTAVFDTRSLMYPTMAAQGDPGKANFNPAVQPNSYNYRTFPAYLLRADYTSNWDANVEKAFSMWEKSKVEVRLDCFNLLNRPQYAAPNLSPTSSAFATTTGVLSGTLARQFQVSAHIVF
ncbi:MAG: carboxypeptidase-like regulatory domain-containing protein [Terracidiphilus sp.]|nr:carboxypeptidase-like regulatory domain-containing protein [Terracidiphilus sp.]